MLDINSSFLLEAFLFGCVIAAAIGPIALIIVNISIKVSRRLGIICGLAAATADLTCAFVAFFLYGSIVRIVHNHYTTIKISSGILLIALGGYIALAALRSGKKKGKEEFAALNIIKQRPFTLVYLLTLASPMTIPVFIAFIGTLKTHISTLDKIVGPLFLFLGGVLINGFLAIFAHSVKKHLLKGNALMYINIISGLSIAAFGVKELFS